MATSLTTRAIILRRTNYGEADRILTILTPEYGQQAVIARAVRRESGPTVPLSSIRAASVKRRPGCRS